MTAQESRRTVAQIRQALESLRARQLDHLLDDLAEDPRVQVQQLRAAALARRSAAQAERRRLSRLYALESGLRHEGFTAIAGLDEVGRGSLAGPLIAAAVVLPARPRIEGLDDSKRLTPENRADVASRILDVAIWTSIASVSPLEIDALGMGEAIRVAMRRALNGLAVVPDHVLVDGLPVGIARREIAVVGGDAKVAAIAAASVIAKVARDALMVELASEHPEYGFAQNKGYSTREHLRAIERLGPSPVHRRSFAPCGGTLRLFDVDEVDLPR